jgi:hypothetical protein
MKRRIIRITTEDSANYIDIIENKEKLLLTAVAQGGPTSVFFSFDNNNIDELIDAIQTLRPAKTKEKEIKK